MLNNYMASRSKMENLVTIPNAYPTNRDSILPYTSDLWAVQFHFAHISIFRILLNKCYATQNFIATKKRSF